MYKHFNIDMNRNKAMSVRIRDHSRIGITTTRSVPSIVVSAFPPSPEIQIYETSPVYKSWPRDCSLVYDYLVQLNCSPSKRGEIYEWMNRNAIPWKAVSDRTFRINDRENMTLFKMTWL